MILLTVSKWLTSSMSTAINNDRRFNPVFIRVDWEFVLGYAGGEAQENQVPVQQNTTVGRSWENQQTLLLQMLSTEDPPPDLSCPSNLTAVESHERASQKIAFQGAERVALEENPASNFSIREYVRASRSKCVEVCWPFPQQFLQHCLTHGLKDLLPPFEHPDLVRAQCLRSAIQLQQPQRPIALISSEEADSQDPRYVGPVDRNPATVRLDPHNFQLQEIIPKSSSVPRKSTLDEGTITLNKFVDPDVKIATTVRTHHQTEQISDQNAELTCSVAISKTNYETPVEQRSYQSRQTLEKLCKPPEKKCRLKVRLSVVSEISQADNSLSISSTVSDSMASKVCPVCKTFSSTSNTTLNAHIDQCLFMDSNANSGSSNAPKVKVRQRKMRLMTEIYMTALHGTLEDLDRRNGTNWAVELAFLAAPTSGVVNETKIPNVSTTQSRDGRDASDAYVDLRGAKVKILSKSNISTLEDDPSIKKHIGVVKVGKSNVNIKKKNFTSTYLKKMKRKEQNNKLLLKLLKKDQFIARPEGDHISANHPLDGFSRNENQVESSTATLRRSVGCSRLDSQKKLPNRSSSITLGSTLCVNRSIIAENKQSDPCNSSGIGRAQNKSSRPSELLTGFPKMRRVECLYNDHLSMNDMKRKSLEIPVSSSILPSQSVSSSAIKLPANTCLSTENKSMDVEVIIQHESDTYCDLAKNSLESVPSSSRQQATSISKKNICVKRPFFHLEGSKGETSERSIKNKFRKQRSILTTYKRRPPYLLPVNGDHGTTKNVGLITRKYKTVSSHLSGLLNNFSRPEPEVMNQGFANRRNECSGTVEEQEDNSSNTQPWRAAGCHDTATEDLDVLTQAQNSGPTEKAVDDPIANDSLNSEKLETSLSTQSDSFLCADDVQSLSTSEVNVEHSNQGPDQQLIVCDEILFDGANHQDIPLVVETVGEEVQVSSAVKASKCRAETTYAEDSTDCVTSHGVFEHSKVHRSPSIRSFITTENHDKYVVCDSGQSGLLLSPESSISLPSESSKMNDLRAESSGRDFPVQENKVLESQDAERIKEAQQRNNIGNNGQIKDEASAKAPDKSLNDQPLCCSCGVSISKDSQSLTHNETSRTTNANHVTNALIGPRSSSSFSAYQPPRAVNMANTRMELSVQFSSVNKPIELAPRYPTWTGLGSDCPSPWSPNQASPNPVLRLMGKDLLVMNNEQLVQPPAVPPGCASINNLVMQATPCHQVLGRSPAIGQPLFTGNNHIVPRLPIIDVGGIARPPPYSGWTMNPYQQTQHMKPYKRYNPRYAPYPMDELIVINDSRSEHQNVLNFNKASTSNSFRLDASGASPLAQRHTSLFQVAQEPCLLISTQWPMQL